MTLLCNSKHLGTQSDQRYLGYVCERVCVLCVHVLVCLSVSVCALLDKVTEKINSCMQHFSCLKLLVWFYHYLIEQEKTNFCSIILKSCVGIYTAKTLQQALQIILWHSATYVLEYESKRIWQITWHPHQRHTCCLCVIMLYQPLAQVQNQDIYEVLKSPAGKPPVFGSAHTPLWQLLNIMQIRLNKTLRQAETGCPPPPPPHNMQGMSLALFFFHFFLLPLSCVTHRHTHTTQNILIIHSYIISVRWSH